MSTMNNTADIYHLYTSMCVCHFVYSCVNTLGDINSMLTCIKLCLAFTTNVLC